MQLLDTRDQHPHPPDHERRPRRSEVQNDAPETTGRRTPREGRRAEYAEDPPHSSARHGALNQRVNGDVIETIPGPGNRLGDQGDGLWDHQQTSLGGEVGGSFDKAAIHVRTSRGSSSEDDVEGEVVAGLESLEQRGYVTKIGETKDALKSPIYQVTLEGLKQVNE